MSRPSESGSVRSSKRDSGFSDIVGSFPITSANLRRISLKRQTQMEPFAAESEATSPIYRLYPHVSNNGSRRLRAMSDRTANAAAVAAEASTNATDPDDSGAGDDVGVKHSTTTRQRTQHSFDTAIYAPIAQRHILRLPHNDDVFELDSSNPPNEFADSFVLPPSRAESHDSFATPLSGVSRASTPEPDSEDIDQTVDLGESRSDDQKVLAHDSVLQESASFPSVVEDFEASSEGQTETSRAPSSQPHLADHSREVQDQPGNRIQPVSAQHTRDQSVQVQQLPHSRQISVVSQHNRDRPVQGRYTPSLPDLAAHARQSFAGRELSPIRGREPLEVYKPRGYRLSGRASSASLNSFAASNRTSMGFLKVSSTGEIADFDDNGPETPNTLKNDLYSAGDRSSAESIFSQETNATSFVTLPPLQSKGPDSGDAQQLEPLLEDDPRSFDLVDPPSADEPDGVYALEKRADLMFSQRHLQGIFDNPKLLMKFTSFLNLHRPKSIPLLIYYLDALKALRAIKYANAVAEALEPINGQDFTKESPRATANNVLEGKLQEAFKVLAEEDLPAYISYVWIQVVSTSIQRRITGTLAPHLREASEGLAETFCLSDPSRKDNPVVFVSEEFARTTQYGMGYAIGRNCRFLQGPRTSPYSVRRLAMACRAGVECNEVFVNYRRDGSPFLNLLMIAPLMDSKGVVRYYFGAQVDVSGLLKGCSELPALADLVDQEEEGTVKKHDEDRDEFRELTEMFNGAELDTVRKYGGRMHKEYVDNGDTESLADRKPRMVLHDSSQDILQDDVDRQRESSVPAAIKDKINGKLEGVYQHYLLVRPAPSLRILFTSPSLRVPGILQSPFLHRIGGSARVRNDLSAALAEGRGVTAKIRWLLKADEDGEGEGRSRWIHCTPLLGHSGSVGVWMIVLVEDEMQQQSTGTTPSRRFREAPPVSDIINGRDWDNKPQNKRTTTTMTNMTSRTDRTDRTDMTNLTQEIDFARPSGSNTSPAASSASKTPSNASQRQTTKITSEPPRASARVTSSASAMSVGLSAPSPDILDKRHNRTSAIPIADFSPVSSNRSSRHEGSHNFLSSFRSKSRNSEKKNSSAATYNVDLR